MPFIDCRISKILVEEDCSRLKSGFEKIMEETAGKSKKYVMIDISCGENLFFGGNKGNCTFCDIRLLGELSKKQKNEITSQITCLVTEITDISADRIYVTFAEYDRDNWGWNSKTFGE